jgi:TonB family protein
MRPECKTALRTWVQMAAAPKMAASPALPLAASMDLSSPVQSPDSYRRRRRQSRKAKWMALAPLMLVVSLVVCWWSWQNGWISADQTTTAAASAPERVVNVPSSEMEHNLLHRVDPTYPDEAVKKKTEGLVVVGATIGTDGAVKQVHPLSGPDLLAQAAVNAVKWWRFEPYQVNGQPTEVQTTIEVDFRLHD